MGKPKDLSTRLQEIYYNPKHPASFSGVDDLLRALKEEGKVHAKHSDVKKWLEKQLTYTLHKPIRRRFPRGRVLVSGMDWQWTGGKATWWTCQSFVDTIMDTNGLLSPSMCYPGTPGLYQ